VWAAEGYCRSYTKPAKRYAMFIMDRELGPSAQCPLALSTDKNEPPEPDPAEWIERCDAHEICILRQLPSIRIIQHLTKYGIVPMRQT